MRHSKGNNRKVNLRILGLLPKIARVEFHRINTNVHHYNKGATMTNEEIKAFADSLTPEQENIVLATIARKHCLNYFYASFVINCGRHIPSRVLPVENPSYSPGETSLPPQSAAPSLPLV